MTRQIGPQKNAIASRFLVSSSASEGYFTTITEALAAAVAAGGSQTILVKDGTYVENISISPNITLQAISDTYTTPRVILQGTITASFTGNAEISGFDIQAPNGANGVYLTGANATILTISNSNISGNASSLEALKIDATNSTAYMELHNCAVMRNGGAPISFVSDSTLLISGASYIQTDTSFSMSSITDGVGSIKLAGSDQSLFPATYGSTTYTNIVGIYFNLGAIPTSSINGADLTFTNMFLSGANFTIAGRIICAGCQGGFTSGSISNATNECVQWNVGATGGFGGFDTVTFSTLNQYAVKGNATGDFSLYNCATQASSPPASYIAPDLIDPALLATLGEFGIGNSVNKMIRLQRETNSTGERLAGLVVMPPVDFLDTGSSFGYYNSLCDIYVTNTAANAFGYWGMNAVYDGTNWLRQGDGASVNGGCYVKGSTSGAIEFASFNSTAGTNASTPNPSAALRLVTNQLQFQPTYGSYTGSQEVKYQATAQTVDATVTTLASVVVNQGESITFSGTIVGAQSDHSNAVGGNFIGTARRQAAGNVTIVGVPIVNVNSSSAATFTVNVDVGTQTIRLQVTGVAATTYNWSSYVTYQKILTNS